MRPRPYDKRPWDALPWDERPWDERPWHHHPAMDDSVMSSSVTVRVVLPQHLRTLANVASEVALTIEGHVTRRAILDALENRYPMLCGTIRDHVTRERRPKVRFYANEEDITHQPQDAPLPDAICSGTKPLLIIGAISGG